MIQTDEDQYRQGKEPSRTASEIAIAAIIVMALVGTAYKVITTLIRWFA
ncbi:hypothetical protein UFOVP1670_58 [uncultured Caudovirales phage]|uniref:Uncharacterized protein n=1 Tax=uncultured Caudovirales phage TaxID=2100421 RepID=A0A6J5T6T0_9CAUD|nr:hypothetical protein UFOVP1670_58 [uncultured Caudovirales phage]